ncbi:hypothetical protein [Poseidonibacter ostreae]|jgi:hypothetical protein|uniref:Uncharacterized protein n=1 Tax=Poseidonibacter ostreae TaxID=2654171 RepID=A0A6L4WTN4_9BACT|nr:hypothetical protein [Poseidonibacter ostreae]KAB7886027.1 hypothetical protein GA417_06660 [Poseidonibacter ostreae]KAB7889479.1 hypothetical protein GBG19_06095 [Poseidonibacter ostreae]KAB7892506.1 hypothetical protein GBG18_02460 [Poseidonibacter ostreae]MAC83597.1 hypothetical protein [Arcobacter sp.]|tara:strand:+ start:6969 stop:7532 length:564 start_codon:yes stop_codon:yes gene_type:complete
MLKSIYLVFIVLFFTSCSSSKLTSINNYLDISKQNKQYTSDSCAFDSYIISRANSEYGDIFIEHFSLNSNCEWNGFQRSYFDNLFKEKTAIKTMVALERIDFPSYEFSTYLINDKYILNLIYEYAANKNTFILDYKGELFSEMIKKFDKNYKNKYLEYQRFSSRYNSSLVNQNIIKNYFNEEIEPLD